MSLLGLRDYLATHRVASLTTLCGHFGCEADLLRHMLRLWIQKGCVRCFTKKPGCGTRCSQCPVADIELYEWLETAGA